MNSASHPTHTDCTLAVDVRQADVDAGTNVVISISCACPEDCDFGGSIVTICDDAGTEIASAVLSDDGGVYATGEITFQASKKATSTRYVAVLQPNDGPEISHAAASTEFTIETHAHAMRATVWGVPSAIAAGELFRFMAGIKCSSGCDLADHIVELVDDDGNQIQTASLGTEHWPGTAALHYVELEAKAPEHLGQHHWRVRLKSSRKQPAHTAGEAAVTLNVVAAPEVAVTVEAIDRDTQTPIPNAFIVMHPYRATTDEAGIAKLRVARGDYRMQVSGKAYLPVSEALSVADRLTRRAELTREPPSASPDDGY